MDSHTAAMNTSRRADRLAAAALGIAIAARIWGAWAGRFLIVPDTAVVGLMARHMAELKEFPVFFYGQAYMGSLEPMASALWVRLLGPTGFAVSLGPVLFSALALVFLWRWARDAAGPWGGLAALLAGLFGPAVYFHFQMAARGGYMVALAVDALAIWTAARMAARLRAGERVGPVRYAALGLVAGIGVWSNLIVAAALLAAALLLWHGMRGRFWRHLAGIGAGLAGFGAGLLPWLVYNVRHRWHSLDMSQVSGHEPFSRALQSTWNRFLMLQIAEIGPLDSRLPALLALAVLGLSAVGFWVAAAQARRATYQENYARAGALLFCLIFTLVFATSGFTRTHTARYWVPVVPGLAVLAAVACAAPGGCLRRRTAWTGLAVLTVAQGFACLPTVLSFQRRAQATEAGYREMGQALERIGTDALMAPIQFFPLNFALEERFAVSDGKQKFYEPILRQVELSEAPAYSSDYKGIGVFLDQQDVTFDSVVAGSRGLLWNLRRTPVARREIAAAAVASLLDGAGAEQKGTLADRNLDTWWSPSGAQERERVPVLEWTFAEPQDVHSVRLVFAHGAGDDSFDFPQKIRMETKMAGEWKTTGADEPIVPLEWSGTRVYFPSGLSRLDYRVEGRAIEGLRLALLDTRTQYRQLRWRLAEAMLYAAEGGTPPAMDAAAVDALGGRLRAEHPGARVHAPRWVSNQLLKRGWVEEDLLAGLADRIFGSESVPRDGTVAAEGPAVFVVEAPFAAATRETLEKQSRAFRETPDGPWVVFAVEAGGWAVGGLDLPPAVLWSGDALMAGHTTARAGEALRRLRADGTPEETRKVLLQEIVRWRPSALSALAEEEVARLGGEDAVQARRASAALPEKPCPTEFADGIRLEGLEAGAGTVKAGGTVDLRLFWSAREGFDAGREVVFIHLRDASGEIVAQDDYRGSPLLWGNPVVRPMPGECVEEIRNIAIPSTAPPGPLSVSIGLYQPRNGRRVKVWHSEAPEVRRHAATWPGFLVVEP